MSKITQALEKAARERLQRLQQEPPVVKARATSVPVLRTAGVGEIATADRLEVDPHIVSVAESKSPIAEQYRIFRTNLQSLKTRPGAKVFVVTSAIHGEGKSVTAINLAMTLARQENLRVALVDADLRKGSVRRWLGLRNQSDGLSAVLQRGGELGGSLLRIQDPPLAILPAGEAPEHPAELLESSHMKRLLATLRAEFDVVVVDAPPVLPVADPGILAAHADGVLLVVRAGKTQRKTVEQARNLLGQMKANILGMVLTHMEYYLPGYYRYYHDYRYGKEGQTNGNGHGTKAEPAAPGAARLPAGEAASS